MSSLTAVAPLKPGPSSSGTTSSSRLTQGQSSSSSSSSGAAMDAKAKQADRLKKLRELHNKRVRMQLFRI
jgi:hypothetical protein